VNNELPMALAKAMRQRKRYDCLMRPRKLEFPVEAVRQREHAAVWQKLRDDRIRILNRETNKRKYKR
jgi:hypothetical protein